MSSQVWDVEFKCKVKGAACDASGEKKSQNLASPPPQPKPT